MSMHNPPHPVSLPPLGYGDAGKGWGQPTGMVAW